MVNVAKLQLAAVPAHQRIRVLCVPQLRADPGAQQRLPQAEVFPRFRFSCCLLPRGEGQIYVAHLESLVPPTGRFFLRSKQLRDLFLDDLPLEPQRCRQPAAFHVSNEWQRQPTKKRRQQESTHEIQGNPNRQPEGTQSVARFLEFIVPHERPGPQSLLQLDQEVEEYVNSPFQDDLRQYWSLDLLSAPKRFLPEVLPEP